MYVFSQSIAKVALINTYISLQVFYLRHTGTVSAGIQSQALQRVLSLVLSKLLETRQMFSLQLILQIPFLTLKLKQFHFFSRLLKFWREIRHSNTHRHGRKQPSATLCKKKWKLFSSSSGQLKIKFTVGSMLDWLKSFRSKEHGGLQQRAENFLQTRDCIGGNFVFIVNPVGLLSAASCCLFQFAIKEGNKSPHNRSDQLRTPFRMSF